MNYKLQDGIPQEWSHGANISDNSYYCWNEMFSPSQCDEIIRIAEDEFPLIRGTIMSENEELGKQSGFNAQVDDVLRDSQVRWMGPTDSTHWIYQWIWDSVVITNQNGWEFDIRGMGEALQYTVYDSNVGDAHYNWHRDIGGNQNHRKVSLTIQLSDESEYEGGHFEMEDVGKFEMFRGKGDAIMFPSFFRHKIHPITYGVRKSLVVWITGPKIK
jgi:PKHD-type hydroxylase